jgi:hypothetical protein
MPVNFFSATCSTQLNDSLFGICDIPPRPAFIKKIQDGTWIATVNNTNCYEVTFVAIDNCIRLIRPDGNRYSSCDCMMVYDNTKIMFIELKECQGNTKTWIQKADSQLKETISHFSQSYNLNVYTKKEAYICNNQNPKFPTNNQIRMQQFKDATDFRLKVTPIIELE